MPRVDHPCVRRVLDTFEADGRRVLVEEWVEGETLDRWIERAAVPMVERIYRLSRVAEALVAAHKAGVVHGVLSPVWVTVARNGEPKLAGLGVGALLGREGDEEDDAFAFGLLAYELVTGRAPFPGEGRDEAQDRLALDPDLSVVQELATPLSRECPHRGPSLPREPGA